MAKPVILAVDDDDLVLRAVERDLRARYAAGYRIVAADSGTAALDATLELTARGASVALFLVDQRMPVMTGIEFLRQAIELQPDAKRVLLTAYADTEVAIQAINEIRLDQYLLKPWDPPDEHLYPVVDDLLEDWSATFRPAFEGVRLVVGRWSPRGHEIRDYLARNQVPYQWLDPEADDEARRLVTAVAPDHDPAIPMLVFPDGTTLDDPTSMAIAEKVGLQVRAGLPFYDVVIIGGGPAGLAAAVYGASEGLKTVLVEREAPGGQAGTTSRIENYLGFPVGLSGSDLARRALTQARRLGAEILSPQEVSSLRREDPYRTVVLGDGSELSCQTVVIASGVSYRQLDLPGVAELVGAGIFYGASISEAVLYRDLDVGVMGGGNSAGQAVVYLSRFASRVHLIVRGADLAAGMSQYLVDQIAAIPSIEVHTQTTLEAVEGEGRRLSCVRLGTPDGEQVLPLAALFVTIGQRPRTDWLEGTVERDAAGFVLTGAALLRDGKAPSGWNANREPLLLESSVPGVFAAGDVRYRSIKRIASAVGEGAMAVALIHQYLASH